MGEQTAATASLKGIEQIEATVRRRSRWHAGYLWTFAAWQLALVPAVLLWHGRTGTLVSTLTNAVVVMGLSLFTMRQPVVPRGYRNRQLTAIGAWTAAYLLALGLGLTVFADSVAFAAVAALACALPPAAAAWQGMRTA
ncbi:hypothetical protein [Streptomyces sp. NBC_00091]|uniref:hypothetical protein n=1 Tax=Streptomyces sp. NBC_00091 TaxID=2975648 RepID=UPI00224E1723|nr:hypothetical protein [Streptomyces sp. NBC_00091]MCX5375379.1 hypothetical protein [Streptomyces sp. NBC_00091]